LASVSWILRAVDSGGRIIADVLTVSTFAAPQITTYIFQPGDGLRTFEDTTHGAPQLQFGDYPASSADSVGPTRFLADGRIMTFNAILTDIDDREFAIIRPGSQTATITKYNGERYVAGINQFNELILFHYQGTTWTVRRIGDNLVSNTAEITMFGGGNALTETFVVLADDGDLLLFGADDVQPGSVTLSSPEMRTPIVRNLTSFTNTVGVVHLAGLDADGHLVLYFRNESQFVRSPFGWTYDDLTETHFDPQSMATPMFASHLTAYSTSWNGMNIAGLDSQGHVQVTWWAPGMTLWQLADVSASTQGAEAVFTGEISAFVTPWNTMHINGVLASTGETAALWWAPGFGEHWRADELSPGGLPLLGSSITAFITPWAALNVAGINADTGELDVYWWTPTTNQWISQPVLPFAQHLVGRLNSYVEVVGSTVTQSIFAQAEDGSLLQFSWTPGDTQWSVANLTELV
ncbi:MAG: hypothetical protein H7210_06255, partial [Pyrinomonadaceae bacterium]|nr:hypothetical protein [Phycisphaerales bacterium]